jgi:16S rRNA (cytosine967-C5)-methyltransferase
VNDKARRTGRPGQAQRSTRGTANRRVAVTPSALPTDARRVAVQALVRIDTEGAYANLILPSVLARSGLPDRDRAFVTQLVYGTTRLRRACDWFVDRFVHGDLDPEVRAALRLGVFQLRFLGTPPHAAVSATVAVVPRRARGLVNAVLRRVSEAEDAWPSDAVRLSYPDWIADALERDLGADRSRGALEAMNGAAPVTERADGYIQDEASQWVAAAVGAEPGERVLDLCAAPGGKATALAGAGAWVVAGDIRPARAGLISANASRLEAGSEAGGAVNVVVADGLHPPFASASFQRVLVDAPCSGLGSLRRRADARWRIDEAAPTRLAEIQSQLLDSAADLVVSGGTLVYSVCTLTAEETTGVAERFTTAHPGWVAQAVPGTPWEPWGSGAVLLPQSAGTDGMALFVWRAP